MFHVKKKKNLFLLFFKVLIFQILFPIVCRDVICCIKQENYEGGFMNSFKNSFYTYMMFHGLCLNMDTDVKKQSRDKTDLC